MLRGLGIEFTVKTGNVDESHEEQVDPKELVLTLAKKKAEGIDFAEGDVILSADTVVALGDTVLEKPKDRVDAKRMLSALSGRAHTVYTGYCIKSFEKSICGVGSASVFMRELSEEEIEWYLDTLEWSDKAGGYGIQSLGCTLVEKIEGDYNSVVGLPLGQVVRILRDMGAI